jgi:formate hydrogenlyase subunit 3/multisubunit Na+/H+ antiporter MnhD subunit
VALNQRDVKRMMAYSSINHVGFILLGVEACTARGVSASLYYVFTYMFLVIGTFAVISVVAGPGDTRSQLTDYRGLAKRQPLLALAFAVLLLGQAGAPFTTGFLAKLGVIEASVSVQGYGLATVAMASAAVAAFFYLRLAVTMYSPVGASGDPLDGNLPERAPTATGTATGTTPAPVDRADGNQPVADLQVLTDDAPSAEVEARGLLPVPPLTAVAIGTCVAFSVVFGVLPGPVIDFAHHATLLLLR